MGTTTFYAYPYPEPTASVDVARDIKALAEKLELMKVGLVIPNGNLYIGQAAGTTGYSFAIGRTVGGVTYEANQYVYSVAPIGAQYELRRAGAMVSAWRLAETGQVYVYTGSTSRPIPFATFAGAATMTLTNEAYKIATVSLPAGRFTQTPVLVVSSGSSNFYGVTYSASPTSISCLVYHYAHSTQASVAVDVFFTCTQMLSTASQGRSMEPPALKEGMVNMYATCHTEDCESRDIAIQVTVPDEPDPYVQCGPCGLPLTDLTDAQPETMEE